MLDSGVDGEEVQVLLGVPDSTMEHYMDDWRTRHLRDGEHVSPFAEGDPEERKAKESGPVRVYHWSKRKIRQHFGGGA